MTHTDIDRRALFDARVEGHDRLLPGYRFVWEHWRSRLLEIAGTDVVPPIQPEANLDRLLAEATARTGTGARSVPGRPSSCHENVAELVAFGVTDDGVTVAAGWTGYALSDDGLWRPHSWATSTTGSILETTVDRTHYVGYELP